MKNRSPRTNAFRLWHPSNITHQEFAEKRPDPFYQTVETKQTVERDFADTDARRWHTAQRPSFDGRSLVSQTQRGKRLGEVEVAHAFRSNGPLNYWFRGFGFLVLLAG